MKRTFKTGLSLALAASMIVSGAPTGVLGSATTTKNGAKAITAKSDKWAAFDKKKKSAEKEYKEGEALIMYYSDVVSKKAMNKKVNSDCTIKTVCTFDDVDAKKIKAKSLSNKTGKELTVSLVKSSTMSTEELVKKYSADKDILIAEPNYKYKALDTDDTYTDFQWALDNKGFNGSEAGIDINSDSEEINIDEEADETVIAIIDTGVDYEHEDLQGVMWDNPYEGTKILKGHHGYDFVERDEEPMDENGHGTHCSGIMHANKDNQTGIAGVTDSDNIKIMALRFLDEDGAGWGEDAIDAYNYIYRAQQLGVNVRAINNSWGGGYDDGILGTLIDMVGENGAVSVCAAGNESVDNDVYYSFPASLDSEYIISVAATNSKDEISGFSNYGETTVDIGAPGEMILSTVSYDVFNPFIYDDAKRAETTSYFNSFDNEQKLVKTFADGEATEEVVSEGDLKWGITATGDAEYSVEYSNEHFMGANENNKSLKFSVKGAEAGDTYYFYLPYEAKASSKPIYSSCFVNAFEATGTNDDALMIAYIGDSVIKDDGTYDENGESLITAALVTGSEWEDFFGKGGYWTFGSGVAENKVKEDQERVLSVQFYCEEAGDYDVYLDNIGFSQSNIDTDSFGKYDFYNGTSMATPHVTAATAVVAAMNPDADAYEVRDIVLGSTRDAADLEGKTVTGGVIDLSKVNHPNFGVTNISFYSDEDEGNTIDIEGRFLEGAKVYLDGERVKVNKDYSDNHYICVNLPKYYENKNVTVSVTKDDKTIEKKVFTATGKPFDMNVNNGFAVTDNTALVAGDNDNVYALNFDDQTAYEGLIPVDSADRISWNELYGFNPKSALGIEYAMSYTVDYSKPVFYNGLIYTVAKIDLGYAEMAKVIAYDVAQEEVYEVADVTTEIGDADYVSLFTYNDSLYVASENVLKITVEAEEIDWSDDDFDIDYDDEDFDDEDLEDYTYTEYTFDVEETDDLGVLPEEGLGENVFQVGDKLVSSIAFKFDEEDNATVVPSMIFDGEAWTKSDAAIEFEEGDYSFEVSATPEGLVYTGINASDLGDTFEYDVEKDEFVKTGYKLAASVSDWTNICGTVVAGRLYVIEGDEFYYDDDEYYDDWSLKVNKVKAANEDEEDYEDEDDLDYDLPIIWEYNIQLYEYDVVRPEPIEEETTAEETTVEETTVEETTTAPETTTVAETTTVVKTTTAPETTTVAKPHVKKAKIKSLVRKSKKKAKLTIKKMNGVDGYQIKYSTSKKFTKKTTKTLDVKKNVVTLKKLKSGKKYYVKVRAYVNVNNSPVVGKWSRVKKLK